MWSRHAKLYHAATCDRKQSLQTPATYVCTGTVRRVSLLLQALIIPLAISWVQWVRIWHHHRSAPKIPRTIQRTQIEISYCGVQRAEQSKDFNYLLFYSFLSPFFALPFISLEWTNSSCEQTLWNKRKLFLTRGIDKLIYWNLLTSHV